MPRGYRLFFVALAGLVSLAAAFYIGRDYGLYSQKEGYKSYRYASDKPLEFDSGLIKIPNSKSLEYRAPCEAPKGKDESDLCAQWKAADAAEQSAFWAKWGVWATVAGIVGLIVTIIQGRAGLKRATDANKIAREAIGIENRAWLSVDVLRFPGLNGRREGIDGPHYWGLLTIKIKNQGSAVATDVFAYGKIILGSAEHTFTGKELRDFCAGATDSENGDIFYPNQKTTRPVIVQLAESDIHSAQEGRDDSLIFPYLIFYVSYRTPFLKERRFTAFAYTVGQTIGTQLSAEYIDVSQPNWWEGFRIRDYCVCEIT